MSTLPTNWPVYDLVEHLWRLDGRELEDGVELLLCMSDWAPTTWRPVTWTARKGHPELAGDTWQAPMLGLSGRLRWPEPGVELDLGRALVVEGSADGQRLVARR